MDHVYFFDGNQKRISWVIKNIQTTVEQYRVHAENYFNIVSIMQSKYIALHVGIFWGIGVFIIKNGDTVRIMLDSESMYQHLSNNVSSTDSFIQRRTGFIKQLIDQRNLAVKYELIDPKYNIATRVLSF